MPMMTEMSNKTEPWKCVKHCMEYVQVAILYLLEVCQRKKTNNNLQMTKRKRAEVVLFVGKIN